ncbi:MAG: hypothetical protein WKI04_17095 [Ferruginibacter sp.]
MLRKIIFIVATIGGIVYFFKNNKYSSTKTRMSKLHGDYEDS